MAKKKQDLPSMRSSAAEYLTWPPRVIARPAWKCAMKTKTSLVDAEDDGRAVWRHRTGHQPAPEADFDDSELQPDAVIKDYLTTAADGKNYKTKHYNLQAIIAVGFKVNNPRAVQFRKWAGQIVKDYTIRAGPWIWCA